MIYKGAHRTMLRRVLVFGTAGAVTATVAVVLATSATAATTLGAAAAESGRYFGAAVAAGQAQRQRVHNDPAHASSTVSPPRTR